MPNYVHSAKVISTILKHDSKVTTYKIGLLRAINDVVLAFPDLIVAGGDVAVPLRVLAECWVTYYWPFCDPNKPILQGPRTLHGGKLTNDMAFRAHLTQVQVEWQSFMRGDSKPSDGFFLRNGMRVPRRRLTYPSKLVQAYDAAIRAIATTLGQPIRYAGPGEWSVFAKPQRLRDLNDVIAVPGSAPADLCLVIAAPLWRTFQGLSLWIEALSIHEWCLFTERVASQGVGNPVQRGHVYTLLTDRPDNRRPLTWERNKVDLLLMEGTEFVCPWTQLRITAHTPYAIDHILPLSLYPINELWNLVPSEPNFNSHIKRDRLPSVERLRKAKPLLIAVYENYQLSTYLAGPIREDAGIRFSALKYTTEIDKGFARDLAGSVIRLVNHVADARNITRF
ncbi:MAG: HNH endonuclease domain-containing protein [Chloroflexota bacterium]